MYQDSEKKKKNSRLYLYDHAYVTNISTITYDFAELFYMMQEGNYYENFQTVYK